MTGPARPMVVGVDPGPTPGVAVLWPSGTPESLQVSSPERALAVVRMLVAEAPVDILPIETAGPEPLARRRCVLAVERFVVGKRASRSKTSKAGETTRNLVGALEALAAELVVPIRLRSASEVKTWALAGSPNRIARAGLAPDGMTHAKSAAWHALFAAVHDCGFPDPLSKAARS